MIPFLPSLYFINIHSYWSANLEMRAPGSWKAGFTGSFPATHTRLGSQGSSSTTHTRSEKARKTKLAQSRGVGRSSIQNSEPVHPLQ